MALSGPQALRSLDDAVRDIRREEDEIAQRLARRAERVARLRETEAGLFQQLAEIRLSPEGRTEVTNRLSRVEAKVHAMLEAHAQRFEQAEKTLHASDKKVANVARQRRGVVEEIDTAQGKLRALSAVIAKEIAKDPQFETKRIRSEEQSRIAGEALEKTSLAEANQTQKGRPYRDDPLFMYLWEGGYGTGAYSSNLVTRWIDSLIARKIGYHKARPNFSMLNEIPLRLREHADRQAALAREAEKELDGLEIAAIDIAGGKPLREAINNAQSRLEKIDIEMAQFEDVRDGNADTYNQIAEGRDAEFAEANSMLASALEQQDLANLLAHARSTDTGEDDTIVFKLDDTRGRIADESSEADEQRERLRVLADRRHELENIEWEFKKSHFDDPRSSFREDRLAGDLLNEFLRGAMTGATYWSQWRASQSWRPGTTDWGGGYGLPQSGRTAKWRRSGSSRASSKLVRGSVSPRSSSRSNSGFSRPRSSSRKSRSSGSGGFTTGGGF